MGIGIEEQKEKKYVRTTAMCLPLGKENNYTERMKFLNRFFCTVSANPGGEYSMEIKADEDYCNIPEDGTKVYTDNNGSPVCLDLSFSIINYSGNSVAHRLSATFEPSSDPDRGTVVTLSLEREETE